VSGAVLRAGGSFCQDILGHDDEEAAPSSPRWSGGAIQPRAAFRQLEWTAFLRAAASP